jgi:FkbM family methyltransferase
MRRFAVACVSACSGLVPDGFVRFVSRRKRLSRVLSRVLPDEPQALRVAAGPVEGAVLELRPATEKAFWAGVWEPEIADFLTREAHGVAWDIGAHIGYFSLVLARRADRVVAVEALPAHAARLRRNVALNDAPIDVVEAAISSSQGRATLEIAAEGGMSRLAGSDGIRDAEIIDSVEVTCVTLDSLLADHGSPSLVKIDIEGAETEALRGAAAVLDTRPVILCDIHSESARAEVVAILEAADYSLEWLLPQCLVAHPMRIAAL